MVLPLHILGSRGDEDLRGLPLGFLFNPKTVKSQIQGGIYSVNMYFHEVKSTAHPPIIKALGHHSTDCILKR